MAEIKKENLVALVFASNNCYTSVVSLDDLKIEIDLEKGVWYYNGFNSRKREIPFGKSRYTNHGEGVIGIYDRTNIDHLDSMVHDACEATDSSSSILG